MAGHALFQGHSYPSRSMNQQPSPFHSSESTQTHLNGVLQSLSNIWNNSQNILNYLITAIKEQVQQREALEARVTQLEQEKNLLLQRGTRLNELEGQIREKEEQNKLITGAFAKLSSRAVTAETGWNQCHQHIKKIRTELENTQRKATSDAENYKTSLLEAEQRAAQMSLELENLRVKSAALEHKDSGGAIFATLTDEQKKQMAIAMKKELDTRTQKLTSNVKSAVESINASLVAYRSRIKELEVELEKARRTDVPAPPPDTTDTTQNQAVQFIFTTLNPSTTQSLDQDSIPVPTSASTTENLARDSTSTSATQILDQDSIPVPTSTYDTLRLEGFVPVFHSTYDTLRLDQDSVLVPPPPSTSNPVITDTERSTQTTTNTAKRASASPEVIKHTEVSSPSRKRQRIDTVVPASVS